MSDPVQIVFGSRRCGKTFAADQATRRATEALRGFKATIIIIDELGGLRFKRCGKTIATLPARDRSHYRRGGRYRKPPAPKLARPPEPGMVQVRDRRGNPRWKKLGVGVVAGADRERMRGLEMWGAF